MGRKSSTVLLQSPFADNRFPVWRHRQKRIRRLFIHKRALACRDVTVIRPASDDTNRRVQSNRDSNNNNQSVVRRVLPEMKVILRFLDKNVSGGYCHISIEIKTTTIAAREKKNLHDLIISMKHRVGSGAVNTNKCK